MSRTPRNMFFPMFALSGNNTVIVGTTDFMDCNFHRVAVSPIGTNSPGAATETFGAPEYSANIERFKINDSTIKMTKVCCVSLTLAAKLIGTFGLSLSILMINMLVSNFFSTQEEEEFVIALESWMLFGLNWTYVMKSLKVVETGKRPKERISHSLIPSLRIIAVFAFASVCKKPTYVLPWMYMQMVSIIDQTIALTMQLTQDEKDNPQDDKSVWYVPACSIYLLVSSYFWMVVSSARREWILNGDDDYDEFTTARSTPVQVSNDANMPKTPSFLSSNVALVCDYPSPLPPPKYDIV
ncbi:hypothetical protein TSAR_005181 [Trichomalopsis sarcophagae]|uniref:Uncharacterized protein n=1 Tax=Trichomalopsis sarcophagae TaxID=543379 RepID=A0A232F1T1_9HYME|nr:hypothetical protein TSAR_005181 [Trichomalopsis sarcophagae]